MLAANKVFSGSCQQDRIWRFPLINNGVRLDHEASVVLFRDNNYWIGSHFSSLYWLLEILLHKVFISLIVGVVKLRLKSALRDLVAHTSSTDPFQ